MKPTIRAMLSDVKTAGLLWPTAAFFLISLMVMDDPTRWRLFLGAASGTLFILFLVLLVVKRAFIGREESETHYIDRIDKSIARFHADIVDLIGKNNTEAQKERERFQRSALDMAKQYMWVKKDLEETRADVAKKLAEIRGLLIRMAKATNTSLPEGWEDQHH